MADLGKRERTIQGEAKECLVLLAEIITHLSHHDPFSIGIQLQDELGRFNLWAGNIGVFAPLQASLDFRLIDVPDISSQFLRQLDTLSITLTQLKETRVQATAEEHVHSQGEDPIKAAGGLLLSGDEIVELVQSMHITIDWLHRLSNLVRKASFSRQNQRAAKFDLKDEEGNDVTKCLSRFFEHLIRRECSDLSNQILIRLVETMIIRRRRVLYRRSRQKYWLLGREAHQPQQLNQPVQLPAIKEDESQGLHHSNERDQSTDAGRNFVEAAPSQLTVTTLDQQKYKKLAAPSQISRATTAPFQHDEKLLVPPRPSLEKLGREFVCDYCCLILPSDEVADQDTWAEHVKKDLDPYVCVFDNCSQPYQMYPSTKEWLAHMRLEHRMSWRCVVRDHPPQTFGAREDFINHMKSAHPKKFKNKDLPLIADSCARALDPVVPLCPFCAEEPGNLEMHVAQHLCHFALQSLPWPDQLNQDSDLGRESVTNSGGLEDDERESLKDEFEDGPDLDDINLDDKPEPPLNLPVSWPDLPKVFPEPDNILSHFAGQAAIRAKIAADDNSEKPKTLEEELRQVKHLFPNISLWDKDDVGTCVFRALLRGPWGYEAQHIVLEVIVCVPWTYPRAQAPIFLIGPEKRISKGTHEILEQGVHEISQLCLQRNETCLALVFSYLQGECDLESIFNTFDSSVAHRVVPTPFAEYVCLYEACRGKVFPRSADLERHMKEIHLKSQGVYFCDYDQCPQSEQQLTTERTATTSAPHHLKTWRSIGAFDDSDHLRVHYREHHREDLPRPMENVATQWYGDRNISNSWWRCAKCLRKVFYSNSGWECRGCERMLEPERINARKRMMDIKSSSSSLRAVTDREIPQGGHGTLFGGMDYNIPPIPLASQPGGSRFGDVAGVKEAMEQNEERNPGNEAHTLFTGPAYGTSGAVKTDSAFGSMWPSGQTVQSVEGKTKLNNKGQFVTVLNHMQPTRQNEPSPLNERSPLNEPIRLNAPARQNRSARIQSRSDSFDRRASS